MVSSDWIAISAIAIEIGGFVVGATWGIGKIRLGIRKDQENDKDALEQRMDILRQSFEQKIDRSRRETGEMGAAIREKITQVELHLRDNYVRNDVLDRALQSLGQQITLGFERIDKRLERMENKVDHSAPT